MTKRVKCPGFAVATITVRSSPCRLGRENHIAIERVGQGARELTVRFARGPRVQYGQSHRVRRECKVVKHGAKSVQAGKSGERL